MFNFGFNLDLGRNSRLIVASYVEMAVGLSVPQAVVLSVNAPRV